MYRLLYAVLMSSIIGSPSVAQDEAAAIPHFEGVVEDLDMRFPAVTPTGEETAEADAVREGQVLWSQDFFRAGSSSVQLKLEDRGSPIDAESWIEVRDGRGDLVERIPGARLAQEGEIWTNLSFGSFIEIMVVGKGNGDLAFAVAAISFERSGERVESIIGRDGRQHLIEYAGSFSTVLPSVEGAVAKLTFIELKNGFPARFVCTGFLIADDLLLTNEHCVATQDVCDTTKILFGLSINKFGVALPKEQVRCLQVEKVDWALDYALLRLEGKPGERWGHVTLTDRAPVAGEQVYIVQHPAGEPKQISDEDCRIAGTAVNGRDELTDFSHTCDTLGGSSGSPVFAESGEVIGLHHLAKQNSGEFVALNRAVMSAEIAGELPR